MTQKDIHSSQSTSNVSNKKLGLAVVGAALVAALLLVTVILPAEYGIDPAGTGRLLGLSQMGESKNTAESVEILATTPSKNSTTTKANENTNVVSAADTSVSRKREDRIELVLPPGRGVEVKATMQIGQEMAFVWRTDGAVLYFDFHGDEFNAAKDVFTSYLEGNGLHNKVHLKPILEDIMVGIGRTGHRSQYVSS